MNDEPNPYGDLEKIDVPWQDTKPTHWQVRRIKSLFRERSRTGFPQEPLLAATQSMGVVRKDRYAVRTVTAEKGLHLLKLAKPGDFVISLRSFQGGIELCHDQGIISPAYTVLEPIDSSFGDFYSIFFKSRPFVAGLTLFITGIRDGQNINYAKLSRSHIALPPSDEQRAIVKYVRHIEREIGAAIRAKRQLVTLLTEQKHAIVHQVVTRGLIPSTEVKETGSPWIATIPARWTMAPIKRLLQKIEYGTSQSPEGYGPIRILTMGNVRNGKVNVPEFGNSIAVPPGLTLCHNDLLFNRTNSPDLVGKTGIYDGPDDATISFASYLVRLRVRQEYCAQWLNYVLNSPLFWAYARGHALLSLHQANLNPSRYGQLAIPLPPKEEQEEIARYLHRRESEIDAVIHRTEREISLLHEYQIRLTADVITGKLDVRAAAALLPDVDPHDPRLATAHDVDEDGLNGDLDGNDPNEEPM
ncbi:hypothetical protein ABT340_22620 [Streptosporangium sp. NPDC000239]|uniref:restriction endonuclease subunit S n=1 Tax=Streptosporangium sp. NPDC000239 TaxID=3154248 RepID=UPI0033230F49